MTPKEWAEERDRRVNKDKASEANPGLVSAAYWRHTVGVLSDAITQAEERGRREGAKAERAAIKKALRDARNEFDDATGSQWDILVEAIDKVLGRC